MNDFVLDRQEPTRLDGSSTLDVLSADEAHRLATCEDTIRRGLETFVAVGRSLTTIRDRRLYRATHRTFEDYCQQRWQISRPHASRLIAAAAVTEMITVPVGTEINKVEPPTAESQTRPLTGLLPDETAGPEEVQAAKQAIRETWAEAVRTAPRGNAGEPKVTGRHVTEVVQSRATRRKPIGPTLRDATLAAVKAIERLERIVADDRWSRAQVSPSIRGELRDALDRLAAVVKQIPE